MRRTRVAAAGFAALTLALSACDTLADLAAGSTSPPVPSTQQPTVDVAAMREQLTALTVEPEWPGDYDRDRWMTGWHELDGTHNCDARELALRKQGTYITGAGQPAGPARYDQGTCEVYEPGAPALDGGHNQWISVYDGEVITDPSALDADHVVALGESADSGGHAWSAAKKQRYANTTMLLMVSASSNRSKGARDPSDWLPDQHVCRYVGRWLAVKTEWRLSVDQAEHDALIRLIDRCKR